MASDQAPPEIELGDPRWIPLRPSRVHTVIVLLGLSLALGVLLWVPLTPGWRVALLVTVVGVGVVQLLYIRHRHPNAIRAFYLFDADAVPMQPAGGDVQALRLRYRRGDRVVEAVVVGRAVVSLRCATVPYRLADDPWWRRRFPRILTLWWDALDAEAFRHTRVRLRWK